MLIHTECTIINRLGLHARAAAKLVALANQFESQIQIAKDGRAVNAKSIMGVLMLAAAKGSQVAIITEGTDAEPANHALVDLIHNRFGEAE